MRGINDIIKSLKHLDKVSGCSCCDVRVEIKKTIQYYGAYYEKSDSGSEFRFSIVMLDENLVDEDMFFNVICHQYAHFYCDKIYSGTVAIHGKEWKDACKMLGVVPKAKYKNIWNDASQKRAAKYIVTCPSCKNQVILFRHSKKIDAVLSGKDIYSCKLCKQSITAENVSLYLKGTQLP